VLDSELVDDPVLVDELVPEERQQSITRATRL